MIIIEGPKEELGSFFFGGRLGDKTIRGSGTEFWNPDQGTLDAVRAKFCSRFSVPIVRNLQGGRGARLGCFKGLRRDYIVPSSYIFTNRQLLLFAIHYSVGGAIGVF